MLLFSHEKFFCVLLTLTRINSSARLPSLSLRIKTIRSDKHVWWAADKRHSVHPFTRSPGWYIPQSWPVLSTPFLFSTVVRAKTFSINASFFSPLLLSAGRRVRRQSNIKNSRARCNKANCSSVLACTGWRCKFMVSVLLPFSFRTFTLTRAARDFRIPKLSVSLEIFKARQKTTPRPISLFASFCNMCVAQCRRALRGNKHHKYLR